MAHYICIALQQTTTKKLRLVDSSKEITRQYRLLKPQLVCEEFIMRNACAIAWLRENHLITNTFEKALIFVTDLLQYLFVPQTKAANAPTLDPFISNIIHLFLETVGLKFEEDGSDDNIGHLEDYNVVK